MKFILGTKVEMTQVFDEKGRVYAVTVLKIDPATIVQIKTTDTDGYNAVQVGTGERKAKRLSKAVRGHMKDLGNFAVLREFRVDNPEDYKVGDKVEVSSFEEGDKVSVTGISKGKGFQGVVKRHGFHGGPRTHGQKHSEREPGSIGATGPQRVFKGTRMGGRMGSDKVTVKGLKVVQLDQEKGYILIGGAVPGKRGTLIEVRG